MWMDLEIVILSEVSQRRRNIVWHPLYVESKKKWYKWAYKQKDIHRLRKCTYSFQREGGREGVDREFRMDTFMLLYLKWITKKPCYIAGKCSELCGSLDGTVVWGRMDTCICMAKSFHYSPETITILWIGYT